MRTKFLGALAAAGMAIAAIAPAQAATNYGPGQGYSTGPTGGDARTTTSADPGSGEVMIFQTNTRQAAAVHCVGEGPVAKLRVSHPVSGDVSMVKVNYTGLTMSEHPVVDVLVTGSKTGWLGHGNVLGPKFNESGSVDVPIEGTPEPGETLMVTFGLQVHAGCLPHPQMLGLAGSRFVEGGEATFPSVEIG